MLESDPSDPDDLSSVHQPFCHGSPLSTISAFFKLIPPSLLFEIVQSPTHLSQSPQPSALFIPSRRSKSSNIPHNIILVIYCSPLVNRGLCLLLSSRMSMPLPNTMSLVMSVSVYHSRRLRGRGVVSVLMPEAIQLLAVKW